MSKLDNAHGLVIGIANYQDAYIPDFPEAVLNDAKAIYEVLVDEQLCAYPKDQVTLLRNDEATLERIRQELYLIAQRCTPESIVFIYISSHGAFIEVGAMPGGYIVPVDAKFSSFDELARTSFSSDDFTTALHNIKAGKVTVTLDCCHSAGIGQPKALDALTFKTLPDSYYDRLKQGNGRVIMASSRSDEESVIFKDARNSLYTTHLLAGLRGGIPSADGMIRIFDLFEYLQPLVTADNPKQHPIFKAEIEENYPIAVYLGGGKVAAPAKSADGFRYDAYISYVDQGEDSKWVWETLTPKLEKAGLQVAVSGDVETPGVARVVNIERGIKQAKRTVIVLSNAYIANHMAEFEHTLAQTLGVSEGTYRLLPVKIEEIDEGLLPTRLSMLTSLNLAHPQRAEREFKRLLDALQGPLPTM